MKVIIIALMILLVGCTSSKLKDIPIIDTHVHFFDPQRPEGIMWPPKERTELYKAFLPKHFQPVIDQNNVKASVIVQASNWVSDADWNLKVTEDYKDLYPGVVCNLKTIGTKQFKKDIDRLMENPRIVGLRITHPPVNHEFFTKQFFDDLRYIASKNLTLDILPYRFDFADLLKIPKEVPNLKIILLLRGKSEQEISELAKHKNVFCKLNNFFELDDEKSKEFFELVWDKFGEDRIIFGSDWPSTNPVENGYSIKLKLLYDLVLEKNAKSVMKVFNQNAIRF